MKPKPPRTSAPFVLRTAQALPSAFGAWLALAAVLPCVPAAGAPSSEASPASPPPLAEPQPAPPRAALRILAALERNPGETALAEKLFALFQADPGALVRLLSEPAGDATRQGARAWVLGQFYLRQAEPAKAAEAFANAADLLPGHPAPLAALADAAQALGDTAAERDALSRALEAVRSRGPVSGFDTASLALRLAALRLQNPPDPAGAAAALEAIPDAAWADPGLAAKARRLFAASSQSRLLQEFLEKRIAGMDTRSGAAQAALALDEALMREYAAAGDAERFMSAADRLLVRASPRSSLFSRLLDAVIESALGANLGPKLLERWKGAAAAGGPQSAEASLRVARLARLLPGPESERLEYENLLRYLAANPSDQDAVMRAAGLELASGQPRQASERLARLLKDRPDDSGLVFDLARALLAAGEDNRAVAEINRLLDARPSDAGLQRRALAFFRGNRLWQAAETLLQRLAASGPPAPDNAAGQALIDLADLLIERGREAEAPAVLARLVPSGKPPAQTAAARIRAGSLMAERQLLPAAREQLHAALDLTPDDPAIRLKLSEIETALGSPGRARLELVAAAEAALRLPPSPQSRELLDEADKKLFALLMRRGGAPEPGDGWVKIDLPGLGPVPLRPLPPGARALPAEILRVAEDLSRRAAGANDPLLWRRAGLWRNMMRDAAGAADAFEKGARCAEDRALRLDLFKSAAAALLESGSQDRAAALLSGVINSESGAGPDGALLSLRLLLAKALGAAGQIGEASAAIEEALAAGADPGTALPVLAEIQQAAGYHADALATLRKLLPATRPGSRQRLGIIRNLLRPAEQLGQAAEAARLLLDELLRSADDRMRAEILEELAGIAARNRLSRWLEEQLAAAAASAPGDLFLADALKSFKKNETAQPAPQAPEQAARSPEGAPPSSLPGPSPRPADPAPALEAAAVAWRQSGLDGDGAREAGLRLAKLQEALLDFNAAISTLERLTRLHPRDPGLQAELAALHRRLGDTAAERAALSASLRIEPAQPGLAVRAARLAEAAGDRAEALALLRGVIDSWAGRARKSASPHAAAPALSPAEFFWPPLPQPLLTRLPAFATAGEQRAFPAQIAVGQALRELQRRPASSADGGREALLSAIRQIVPLLADGPSGPGPELNTLLALLSKIGDEAVWWNALWLAGRHGDALDLLEARCRIESDPPALRVAFLKAALDARAYDRIAEWLSGRARGEPARAYIRIALVLELAVRGAVAPELLDALLSGGELPAGFIGQTADLLGRLSAPGAALHTLGKLSPAEAARLPTPSAEDKARWLTALGRKRDALRALDEALPAAPIRSGSDPALGLLRLRWLLTPPAERHELSRHGSSALAHDPVRAALISALESELGAGPQPAAPPETGALAARLGPEAALDLGMALRGWGLRRSALSLLEAALRNPGVLTPDDPATVFFTDQIRLLARAWAMEDTGGAGDSQWQPLSSEPPGFLHNLAGALESAKLPASAAAVYGEIVRSMDESGERGVFLRSQMTMLRAAGRLDEAAAILRPALEKKAARRGRKPPAGQAEDDERGFLVEQAAALAAEYGSANAPEQAFSLLDLADRALPEDAALAKARFDLLRSLGRFTEAFDCMAALARRLPSTGEYSSLAAQAAIEAGTPERGISLIENAWGLPPAQRQRRLLDLALAAGDTARASALARNFLTDDPGNVLPPVIHDLIKRGRLQEAAYLVHLAKEAGADAPALFNLRAALAIAISERPAPPPPLIRHLSSALAETAAPLGGRGALLEFSALIEMLFRLPADNEASSFLESRLLDLIRENPGDLPAERALEIALRTGRGPFVSRMIESLLAPGRITEQTLFFAASSLQAHNLHDGAVRVASLFAERYPLQAAPLLMRTLSENLLSGAPPGPAFERALDLAVFDPEAFGRAALLLADLGRNREALALFALWEKLVPDRNPAILAAAAKLRVTESPAAPRAEEAVRAYLAGLQTLPDLSPLAAFHEKFAPADSAAALAAKFRLEPFLANSLALAIFQNLAARDPARAVAFLEQHPALFHIPARPLTQFAALASAPASARQFRELLTRAAAREPALPLRQLLDGLPPPP